MKVFKTQTAWHLRQAAATEVGLAVECAVVAEIDRHRKPIVLYDRKSLLDVREDDEIVLYETMMPLPEKEFVAIPIVHVEGQRASPTGLPLLLTYPKTTILYARDVCSSVSCVLYRVMLIRAAGWFPEHAFGSVRHARTNKCDRLD